ncbi:MAG: tetratricopeptide repeat protein [Bacteroidota bacterium]
MKNLIPHFIQKQLERGKSHGHFQAYTMFIDLSGFTALTDRLMRLGNEGAEQLSVSLNNIFAPMVKEVYRRGGYIPYFAGDAFNAIFPAVSADMSARKLVYTAQKIRSLLDKEEVRTSRFGSFPIGIKIGLSYGDVEWGIVGSAHKTFYFRGEAIRNSVESQRLAGAQQIIFDDRIKRNFTFPDIVQVEKGFYRYGGSVELEELEASAKLGKLTSKIVKLFLPQAILSMQQGGEFRPVVSVFISFQNVKTHRVLNDFATIILNAANNFSAYLKELEFGDKGGVIALFFGAPVSFENNVERALEFILSIQEDIQATEKLKKLRFRVGVASGLAFTGFLGGEERCQYAAVGTRVNLAARLMTFADWKEVLVDEEIEKEKRYQFVHRGDIHYKGIAGDVPTYKLIGRNVEDEQFFSGEMLGRNEELMRLLKFADPVFRGKFAGITYLYGEAGIGKSRLSFEFKRKLQEWGEVSWFVCQADQILRKSFNPFVYFLKNYFKQSSEHSMDDNKLAFEGELIELLEKLIVLEDPKAAPILKELQRTQSVLAGLMGLTYEGSLWEDLDARGRFQNELSALSTLFLAEALINPMIIVLEDGHWFDNSSKVFLNELSRKFEKYPICILVTSRYLDDGTKPVLFDRGVLQVHNIPLLELDLGILSGKALRQLAERRLGGPTSDALVKLLKRSTNGNPFYAEQVLEYFAEGDLLEMSGDKWNIKDENIRLSSSINAILMARIDRLSQLVKETVKTAAVIGREFEVPILSEVMKDYEAFRGPASKTMSVLREQIKSAEQGQIWRATNELKYIFQHSLLREAVYDMQLLTKLRYVHQLIGEAIEKLYPDTIKDHYYDLAYHYEQARNVEKANEYFAKAAQYAAWNFQNLQAITFYDKLITNLKKQQNESETIQVLLQKANIQELIGQWDDCETTTKEALDLARSITDHLLIGQANNQLGRLLILKGQYEDARMYLETAIAFFDAIKHPEGNCDAYGNLGNLFFRQGNYEEAKSFFVESLNFAAGREDFNIDPQIVANLGLTLMNQGKYDESIKVLRKYLDQTQKRKDKQGQASLYTNIGIVYLEKGDYDQALSGLKKGLALSEELGNRQLIAIATGCVGSVYERKGDYQKAMENFNKDLEICIDLGDKQGMAIALGLIGDLFSVEGKFDEAIRYSEDKLRLCEELGYRKGKAKAINTLGDIYAYRGDFEKSADLYQQAIDVSRAIDNKLVLGFSLAERTDVLLRLGRLEDVKDNFAEAKKIVGDLDNPDLKYEVDILSARIKQFEGQEKAAIAQLESMLQNQLNKTEEAGICYELSKLLPQNKTYLEKALKLYRMLYAETPKHLFRLRLDAMERRQ